MRLIGMMCCRNEDWCLAMSARVALMWCDALVILDHSSTDYTPDIIAQIASDHDGRVTVISELDPEWQEMRHRQLMLQAARDIGATHLAIIDSDEVLSANLLDMIRTHVESMAPGRILHLPLYNLRGGLDRCHTNGIWAQNMLSTAFRDEPRMGWSGDRFHHREPADCMPSASPIGRGFGGVMHLWGASERRLLAKHALYKMTETLRWPDKPRAEIDRLYNQAFFPEANPRFDQDWSFATVPAGWWAPYIHLRSGVNLDGIPWQEEACVALHVEHGAERFAGLDLFGVVSKQETVGAR